MEQRGFQNQWDGWLGQRPRFFELRWGVGPATFYAVGALFLLLSFSTPTSGYDLHFDYTSFENSTGKHFQQAQFNVLNYPSINGNYMMTSTDNHRPEMVANGNALAQFYSPYCCATGSDYLDDPRPTATEEADRIHAYTTNNSTNNGSRPEWVILNEISPSLWQQNPGPPSQSAFRTWALESITRLTEAEDVYGEPHNDPYKVIILSPYQQLGQTTNAPSWQAISNVAYIGIEAYLDGEEVWTGGTDYASRVAYAQGRYQAAKNSYLNNGVPAEKLFVIEHVGNTVTGTNWGRGGIPAADWDQVLMIRQDAIKNVGFAGFLTYAWGGNNMNITEAEQIQHEYYYRTRLTLATEKPQWLSDSAINVNGTTIPLSWSQFLNWKGGVPNANGAEVNFWRTITANRTITLDGSKTVGKLSFDSPFSYTIGPGTGGSLIFNNSGSTATLTSNQGSHSLGVGVSLSSNFSAAISTGTFTISGVVSGTGAITKSGAGALTLNGANTFTGTTTVQAGTLTASGALARLGGGNVTVTGGTVAIASGVSDAIVNTATLSISGGGAAHVNLGSGVNERVAALLLAGVAQLSGRTYGSTSAVGAMIQDNTYFTGSGVVTVGLLGDYNGNSTVDTADYLIWRKSYSSNTAMLTTWRANYGQTSAGSGQAAGVPEPASGYLLLAGMLALCCQRPRR